MFHVSRVTLLICIVYLMITVTSETFDLSKCSFWTRLKLLKCQSSMNECIRYANNRIYSEVDVDHFKRLSGKFLVCVEDLSCEEIDKFKTFLEYTLELANYDSPDNKLCLKGFFKKAHSAQLSKEESCYQEFSFLDQDGSRRREAFTDGKLCFIKYVRDHCTGATLEYFNFKNYKKFVDYVSFATDDRACKPQRKMLDSIRCNTVIDEYNSRLPRYDSIRNEFRLNKSEKNQKRSEHPFVIDTARICRDVLACKTNSCIFGIQLYERDELSRNCDSMERDDF